MLATLGDKIDEIDINTTLAECVLGSGIGVLMSPKQNLIVDEINPAAFISYKAYGNDPLI